MTSLSLHVVRVNRKTFTLGWEPVDGAIGYRFINGLGKRSHTWDGRRSTVRVNKGDSPYTVQALVVGAEGSHWEHA